MQEPRLTYWAKAVLVLLAMAFVAAGCGGSDDSTASSPVTKAQFIKRADRICLKADAEQPRELNAYRKKYKQEFKRLGPVEHEATVATDHIIPSVKRQIRELESLEPPAGGRKEVDAILAGFNRAVKEGEEDPYSIANFWVPEQDPLARINEIATRYGFEVCNELR